MAIELAENKICASVGQVLEQHYNGWRWFVECRAETGVVSVRNLDLDGNFGFVIPLHVLLYDIELTSVVMGAGEILERYGQRAGWKPEALDIDRDLKGNAVGDTDGAGYGTT